MAPSRVVLLFQFYPLLLPLLLLQTVSTVPQKTHKQTLSLRGLDRNFKTYEYTQTLDHFNYAQQSYATFKQRYVVNSKYWSGANSSSPVLVYLGAEGPLEVENIGFLNDNAPYFSSLNVFVEHRFYGVSKPLGSMEEALKNDTIRGYFNSAQALADYAEIILYIKRVYLLNRAPVIVCGERYGGMLAAWFRLKYPHLAMGAVASSAPILYFDKITPRDGYDLIVAKDFKDVSKTCFQTIQNSWAEIDEVASKPRGLSTLSQTFKTCSCLNDSAELKEFLESMYEEAAQFDAPPDYPVSMVCKGIDGAPKKIDILDRIFAGVVSYRGNMTCYDTNHYKYPSETTNGWQWQTCTEMVTPMGSAGGNETLFPGNSTFKFGRFKRRCKNSYGVPPRSYWVPTYYGGPDIKLVLNRFASNIIFSNGLRDPYSSGGVLEDLSESIVAVTTLKGSHSLDMRPAAKTDPAWLVFQRKTELNIINRWLRTYHSDMDALVK